MSLQRTISEINYTYEHEKYEQTSCMSESHSSIYANGAVACDSAVGSVVGKNILEQDGSAVDAAISCLLCNSLFNAQSMGIGGGFFMLYYNRKEEKITAIDARETAPLNSTVDMFKNTSRVKGGLSIGIPGEIKGYWLAHKMFGNLKWSKLFQPAIEMCNNGFYLPASQVKYLNFCEPKMMNNSTFRETFINKISNQIYNVNNIIRRPKLGKTLEIIARDGESAFYDGQLTDTIVEEIQSNGGIITKADLQSYNCLVKEPVSFKLSNDIELNTMPAPSCGILLNFILGIMEGFEHPKFSLDCNKAASSFYHHFIEACKFGFGLRYLVGDECFNDSKSLYRMLSDQDIINEYKDRIKENQILPLSYYGSKNFVSDNGTAHTSIIAPNGDAVAITSSINLVFGSKIIGDKTNIIYNNQMDDFSVPSSESNSFSLPNYPINYIEPGKRPVSSMAPLIAVNPDKNVRLVCGSSGGTRIITSTALTVSRNLLLNHDLVYSVNAPRVHHQLEPDEVLYENLLDTEVIDNLSGCGHKLKDFGVGGSAVQAIERLDDGRLLAVCDYRKGGKPSGL